MRFSKRKLNSSRKPGLLSLFAVLLSVGMLSGGLVYAKYIRQSESTGTAVSREFYFASDLLSEEGETYTLASGTEQFTFYLCNHDDDLRSSKLYVYYTVTVNNGATVSPASGEIVSNKGVQHQLITVSGLQPGQSYTITATTEGTRSKYGKTLTATVVVPATESVVYKSLDTSNSEYVLLTVWSQGYQGNVQITPPAGVIPDNTDPVMKNVQTGQTFTDSDSFSGASYNSQTYRFFGNGVTVSDFTVTYGANGEKTAGAQELLE